MHDEIRLQQVPRTDIHADRDMKAGLAPNFDLGQRSLDGPFPHVNPERMVLNDGYEGGRR
ncbi:hypothetical protein SDC9_201538 [bioreactor metagenome]|uniref:Uncharacterized protein n=1 Tax=bioreactor metagenome TaxID=1076179 RepID=A0A645ISF9_9ZZZZ